MKLQYFKDNFYKIATVFTIAILLIVQGQSLVKAQVEDDTKTVNPIEQQDITDENIASSPNLPNIPNASCLDNLSLWDGGSSTFNPNTPYSILFMREQNYLRNSQFQDINGDNLPDYILFKHGRGGSSEETTFTSDGCVYLNNGSGWDLVFQCMSTTTTNNSTGQVISQNYKGDCSTGFGAEQEN